MRELFFRGKRVEDGQWEYGGYGVYYSSKEKGDFAYTPYIMANRALGKPSEFLINKTYMKSVKPNTVCQYTGLKDKNGKKIFEGDILRHADETILKTVWNSERYRFAAQCVKGSVLLKDCKWGLWEFESDEVEVIGNIYDNPELLEDKENKHGENI